MAWHDEPGGHIQQYSTSVSVKKLESDGCGVNSTSTSNESNPRTKVMHGSTTKEQNGGVVLCCVVLCCVVLCGCLPYTIQLNLDHFCEGSNNSLTHAAMRSIAFLFFLGNKYCTLQGSESSRVQYTVPTFFSDSTTHPVQQAERQRVTCHLLGSWKDVDDGDITGTVQRQTDRQVPLCFFFLVVESAPLLLLLGMHPLY